MYTDMPVAERNRLIKSGAHYFAEQTYKREHPRCSDEEAQRYGVDHWREYLGHVIEWMAVCDCLEENDREKAPWN